MKLFIYIMATEPISTAYFINPYHLCVEKPIARGCNWATLLLGEMKARTWPSWLRESQNKYSKLCS
jgi:hypothetical protein